MNYKALKYRTEWIELCEIESVCKNLGIAPTGVRPDGFALPRQHALVHYVNAIHLFGSPNGLCSSITESKHIEAVKRTWRRSSRNEPILQMLQCLTRLQKMAAARIEFGRRGMLQGDVHTAIRLQLGDADAEDDQAFEEARFMAAQEAHDAQAVDDVRPSITLAKRRAGIIMFHGVCYILRNFRADT